jgi:hypothetical protein
MEGQPPPVGHNLPVLRTRAAFDQFPGGWWVAPSGKAYKKFTQAEHHERMQRRQFGDERYEWLKKHQVPLKANRKTGEWEIDKDLWAVQKDLYAREHPKPEKPPKTKPLTREQVLEGEAKEKAAFDKLIPTYIDQVIEEKIGEYKARGIEESHYLRSPTIRAPSDAELGAHRQALQNDPAVEQEATARLNADIDRILQQRQQQQGQPIPPTQQPASVPPGAKLNPDGTMTYKGFTYRRATR